MNHKPDISVCMITYNHEGFIAQAIRGVLTQKTTYDLELVIVNDCSQDETDSIIKNMISTHDRGHIIKYKNHDENLGMMSNFGYALKSCNGKYIALCEGDDYWSDPNKLQKQIDFLEHNKDYVLVGHNANFVKGGEELEEVVRKVDESYLDFSTSELIKRNPFVSSMVSFKNEGLDNIDEILSHFIVGDKAVFTRLSFLGKTRFYSNSVGYYRKHSDSVTSQNRVHYEPYKKELINRIKHAEYWNQFSNNTYNAEAKMVKEYRSRVLTGSALRNHDYKTAIYYSKFVDLKKIKKLRSKVIVSILKIISRVF